MSGRGGGEGRDSEGTGVRGPKLYTYWYTAAGVGSLYGASGGTRASDYFFWNV